MQILVEDDDEDVRSVVGRALTGGGHRVEVVRRERDPDVDR